jgi:ArsR family transcriptional regulator
MNTKSVTIMKSLSDKTRLEVLEMVVNDSKKEKSKGLYVEDILKKTKVEPTLLSHHLRILKDNGFIQSKRDGKKVIYTLKAKVDKVIQISKNIKLSFS